MNTAATPPAPPSPEPSRGISPTGAAERNAMPQPAGLTPGALPPLDLRHLLRITDDTGILQHATWAVPDHHHGYCVDDNCRALIAALHHARLRGADPELLPLDRYLAFIAYALNEPLGRFRNFMSYDRRWLEDAGSDDSHGRTLWALGLAAQLAPGEVQRGLARRLFLAALPAARRLPHARSIAFTLLGLDAFLQAELDDDEPARADVIEARDQLGDRLMAMFQTGADEDWPWFEDLVTYDNAKPPHALLLTAVARGDHDMRRLALRILRWLIDVQRDPEGGHLSIIGNAGWLTRQGDRARFDQQPLEAHALVEACLAAARVVEDDDERAAWVEHAWWAASWFFGQNDVGESLYNPETGGCRDGLTPRGVNRNEGAESTLAMVLSVLALHDHAAARRADAAGAPPHVSVRKRSLGLAVIGASEFAAFCLDSYRELDAVRPVAVWNRTPARGEAMARRFGLDAETRLESLLERDDVDLVHVASAPSAHAAQGLAALGAGKHVLMDKPMATAAADALALAHAAAERDLRLTVNFMMRFGPLAEAVQRLVAERLLGEPICAEVVNLAGDGGLPEDHWFWNREVSGGIFIEHGVHFFDLIASWFGAGHPMHAFQRARPASPGEAPGLIDQVGCDALHGPGQTLVSYYHGFHQPSPIDRQRIRLNFEQGEVTLHGWVAGRLELDAVIDHAQHERLQAWAPEGTPLEVMQRFEPGTVVTGRRAGQRAVDLRVRLALDAGDPQTLYAEALRALMRDLTDAIARPGRPLRVPPRDGVAAVELAAEADRLARGTR